MNTEEYTKEIPEEDISYGYKIRDYRGTGSGLRWSWASSYRSGDDEITNYNYTFTRIGAIFAARMSLVIAAFQMGARQK